MRPAPFWSMPSLRCSISDLGAMILSRSTRRASGYFDTSSSISFCFRQRRWRSCSFLALYSSSVTFGRACMHVADIAPDWHATGFCFLADCRCCSMGLHLPFPHVARWMLLPTGKAPAPCATRQSTANGTNSTFILVAWLPFSSSCEPAMIGDTADRPIAANGKRAHFYRPGQSIRRTCITSLRGLGRRSRPGTSLCCLLKPCFVTPTIHIGKKMTSFLREVKARCAGTSFALHAPLPMSSG